MQNRKGLKCAHILPTNIWHATSSHILEYGWDTAHVAGECWNVNTDVHMCARERQKSNSGITYFSQKNTFAVISTIMSCRKTCMNESFMQFACRQFCELQLDLGQVSLSRLHRRDEAISFYVSTSAWDF